MKIILPGEPISQARMRHRSTGSFVLTYDPNAKEKKEVRHFLQKHATSFFKFPRISFIFEMPIPKSLPKKTIKLYQSTTVKHTKKPDIDNLIKFYLDCLDGIFFEGDQHVSLGPSYKVYSNNPQTIIVIDETSQNLTLQETDFLFQSSAKSAK